jgi:hypothetical protein
MAGSVLLEHLTTRNVLAAIVVSFLVRLIFDAVAKPRYPHSFPRAGDGEGSLAWLKNSVGYVLHYADWVQDGYSKVLGSHNPLMPWIRL